MFRKIVENILERAKCCYKRGRRDRRLFLPDWYKLDLFPQSWRKSAQSSLLVISTGLAVSNRRPSRERSKSTIRSSFISFFTLIALMHPLRPVLDHRSPIPARGTVGRYVFLVTPARFICSQFFQFGFGLLGALLLPIQYGIYHASFGAGP